MNRPGFLIDMDGVIYRGKQLIPRADEFIHLLLERDIPFTFLTNNSLHATRCRVQTGSHGNPRR